MTEIPKDLNEAFKLFLKQEEENKRKEVLSEIKELEYILAEHYSETSKYFKEQQFYFSKKSSEWESFEIRVEYLKNIFKE